MSAALDPSIPRLPPSHNLSPATEKSRQNPTNPDIPHDRNSLGETPETAAANPPFDNQHSTFGIPPPLSPRQLAAIPLLALGRSVNAVARDLGLHRSTVSTWLHHDPAFAAELSRHRDALHAPAATRLIAQADEALTTLRAHLNAPDPVIAHRAARTLLALSRVADYLGPPRR